MHFFLKSARWRRAIEVAGPCPFGTRTADAGRPEPNGAILWAKSKNGREAIFASSLTRDNPHYHKRDVVHLAIIILFIFGFTLMSVVVRDFLSEVQIEPWEQRYFYLQQKFFLIAFVIVVYLAIKQYKRMQIVGIIVALSIGLLLNIHNYVYKYPFFYTVPEIGQQAKRDLKHFETLTDEQKRQEFLIFWHQLYKQRGCF